MSLREDCISKWFDEDENKPRDNNLNRRMNKVINTILDKAVESVLKAPRGDCISAINKLREGK